MKNEWLGLAALGAVVSAGAGGVVLTGCGDDTVLALPDGGTDGSVSFDAPPYEAGNGDGGEGNDGQVGADAGDGGDAQGSTPARLLLSFNGSTQSELVAFGLQSGTIDGFYVYPGFIGTTFVTPNSPWLLEQASDVVARLDPLMPWQVQSSWSVALNDYAADAGYSSPYSDPDGIVVGAGTKTYVLRYTRNLMAVLDSSQVVDGGAPTKTIDLSSELQADGDGYVEMTAGYYDSTTQRVYVLLANIDRFDVASDGYTLLCAPTSPTIVAIDTTSDTLVDLNPDGGSMGWTLPGYDPAFSPSAMVYDGPNDRLLVLQSGCNQSDGDGGAGPLVQREIDAISLTDGTAQKLVDLTAAAFPSGLYYVDAQHVIVQLDTAYMWDPSSSTLGPAIPNAPQTFSLDGQGNLVGITQPIAADGGIGPWTVVSVSIADGGVTTLGTNPFPADDAGGVGPGFVSGAQLWPAP
ncbi:MAG TPA: hypothetical protein VMI75_04960 [Polyangiaceae bacterium]|nr:hypothetical protein [Polyangiaceae bacterium]